VKGVKHFGIDEAMVGFVGEFVKSGRKSMLQSVHGVLKAVLQDETQKGFPPLDGSFEGVI